MYCILCRQGFRIGDRIVKVVSVTIADENCFEYSDEQNNCEMHLECFRHHFKRQNGFESQSESEKQSNQVERTDILSVFNL